MEQGKQGHAREKNKMWVASLAREHTEEAVKLLVDVLRDTKAKTEHRIAASNAILNRGWGMPAQDVNLGGQDEGTRILVEVVNAKDPATTAVDATATPERGQSKEP